MHLDTETSIVNLTASIYRYFGLNADHNSISKVDDWLREAQPERIFCVLIDGMGSYVLSRHFGEHHFFLKNKIMDLSTVFPTATTAATTAFLTGKWPMESGWVGWSQYFKEDDDLIIPFYSKGMYSNKKYPFHYVYKKLPINPIYDVLDGAGVRASSYWPNWGVHHPCNSYEEMLQALEKRTDLKFAYAYWDKLDTLMHQTGPSSEETKGMLNQIEKSSEAFLENLDRDTVVIFIADHGQIDVVSVPLYLDEKMKEMLEREPALEPRTSAFYVKEECRKDFEVYFEQVYGKDFNLYPSAELLKHGMFGKGNVHPRFREFLGDYISVARENKRFAFEEKAMKTKGDHAGILKEESTIPLIMVRGSKRV